MPVVPSANQLTGFYTRATLALNGLMLEAKFGNDPLVTFRLMLTINPAIVFISNRIQIDRNFDANVSEIFK